jgi:hypothetical protein
MVRLAGVKAVRYLGVRPKKLWEVGGRNVPVLSRGDIVLVGETVAISLCRNRAMFESLSVIPSFDVEELPEIVVEEVTEGEENQGEENQGEENQGEENQGEENQGEENQGEENQGEENQGENPPADSEEVTEEPAKKGKGK